MSWYQAISLLLAVYFLWPLALTYAHNLIRKVGWTIPLWERLFVTGLIVNLVMSFAGVPW